MEFHKNKKLSRRSLVVGGAAAGLLLSAPLARRSWAQSGPIRIGVSAPLSGSQQIYGQPTVISAEAAVDSVNKAGGVDGRMFTIVSMDDKGDPNQAIANVREMTGAGINFIVGGSLTATALAVLNIIPSLNSVFISAGISDVRMGHEMFSKYHFMTAHNSYTWCRGNAKILAQKLPALKTWGGVIPDVAVGHYTYNSVVKAIKKYYKEVANTDVTFVDPLVTKYDTTDFKQQVAQLMTSGVDCFYNGIFGSGGITLHQQARQLGLDRRVKAIFNNVSLDVQIGKAMASNISDNIWASTLGGLPGAYPNNPITQSMLAYYKAKAGDNQLIGNGVLGHVSASAFIEAVRKSKSTSTNDVIAALEGLQFDTAKGPAFFRKEDHQLVSDINLIRLGPASTPEGWEVKESATVSASEVINPPMPGQKMEE